MEDENQLRVLQEWDTRENFDCHLMSDRLRVFPGAMNLLQEPNKILIRSAAAGINKPQARSYPAV
jgi:hypothetical protein